MYDAIYCSQRHRRILEDLTPFAEWLIGGAKKRSALISRADQLEQYGGLRLVSGHVDEVV